MKNLKSFQKFNEELNPETYDKIAKTGRTRGDRRGLRMANDADMLQRRNGAKINLYGTTGEAIYRVIPVGVEKNKDNGSLIVNLNGPNRVILSIPEVYGAAMNATYSGGERPKVYFDREGKKQIIELCARGGIILSKEEQNAIPMI